MSSSNKKRYLICIYGIVQGVGFRPYIYQKAKINNILGWVNNAGAAVVIDAEGDKDDLKRFIKEIVKKPPKLASIIKIDIRKQELYGYEYFEIRQSKEDESKVKFISPDIGICHKCMEEVQDPFSRRYRYAFTNCTECGPRYSIIKALPYDRCNTAMKPFPLCSLCYEEYNDPESRRFHTQPNCCSACGPSLFLTDCKGVRIDCIDSIKSTVKLIKEGKIIAIKGIGGFHLCCDAMNEETVSELRRRKNRPHKPLAVMARDIEIIRRYCIMSKQEQELLECSKRPIVLLLKNKSYMLPENIAPNQKRLGIMLPYTAIHYLLFEEGIEFLVMTSGNKSGTPIQYKNKEAVIHLKGIADYFLLHNRDIHNPIDDSVVKTAAGKEMVSRRARGYIPFAQNLHAEDKIMAMGAEQKNTICFSQGGYAYVSQYLGDLKDFDSYELYKIIIQNMCSLFQLRPKVYAHDLHPLYLSTRYAIRQSDRKIAVQHHHAHMASCMAEHNIFDNVIGVIFDGTGLGNDGSIWGGEFFIGNRKDFLRVGHLKPVMLQGGDSAAKEPWRSAACYLFNIGYDPKKYLEVDSTELDIIMQALTSNFNCNLSSSMGRLFDCAAALIGIRQYITYDAQAAIELENIIDTDIDDTSYDYSINENINILELDFTDIISGLLRDKEHNISACSMSAKFHNTISNATVDMVLKLRNKYQINKIVLSGGVFENIRLLESIFFKLKNRGFKVYFNEQIPINDSGISVGQLIVANEAIRG